MSISGRVGGLTPISFTKEKGANFQNEKMHWR